MTNKQNNSTADINISKENKRKYVKRISVDISLYYELKIAAFNKNMEVCDYLKILIINRDYIDAVI